MTLDAYVKMVTCECGYFQGDDTFDVHTASSLQEFSEKNMKYYRVHHDINPLMPKSAIWHKMPLHAQYLVNLCEICTAKRPWKDLHIEGIKLNPPPI